MGTGLDSNLPAIGSLAWGAGLNSEILYDEALLQQTINTITNHTANAAPGVASSVLLAANGDPHADRAYASNLVAPITFGVNNGVTALYPGEIGGTGTGINPSGYVRLVDGQIPFSLMPGGSGLSNFVDVVKDYQAVGNGSHDDSTVINNALAAIDAAGGGIVFLPGGYNFAIGSTLVIGANTWLMVSPDAIITRIAGGGGPPTTMLCNYSPGGTPATGNILVTGGVWNFNNVSTSGTTFSFANCKLLTIQNTNVQGRPDGASPVGKFFGCSFVLLDNIVTTAPVPVGALTRASVLAHLFEFRYLNSTNVSGLASGAYVYNATTNPLTNRNVQVRNCPLNALTSSDGQGNYSGWYSMCGNWSASEPTCTILTVHEYFIITGCSATCLAEVGISFYNVNFVTHKGCAYNFPPAPYFQGFVGGTPSFTIVWDTEGNAPEKFFTPGSPCTNTTAETIVIQFPIPPCDWLPGSSSYAFDGVGHFNVTGTPTVTFKMYLGILGTTSDTLVATLGPITMSAGTNKPWHVHCHHIGIDSSALWWAGEFALVSEIATGILNSACGNNSFNGSSYCSPNQGVTIFLTVTATWSVASASNACVPHNHVCRRAHT